jgi:hypothetical protein
MNDHLKKRDFHIMSPFEIFNILSRSACDLKIELNQFGHLKMLRH